MPTTPSPDLQRIFYVSRCLATPLQVEEILTVSRSRNAHRGVTGALLFTGGCFAQVLEGKSEVLEWTMASIRSDARHDCLAVLSQGFADERRFAAWFMGYGASAGADDLVSQLIDQPIVDGARAERLMAHMFNTIAGGAA